VALASWAGRPSEGRALLGGVRDVPLLSCSRAPIVTDWPGAGFGDIPTSETEPVETLVQWPPREEEPRREDQGAFRRQQPARYARIAPRARVGSVSPHAAPTEGALRSVASTVPGGADEPRLFMPWLGKASAFVTDPSRLALTNEAATVARSAGPR
jgi:hypothetical protein